jgi:hypothetical protein
MKKFEAVHYLFMNILLSVHEQIEPARSGFEPKAHCNRPGVWAPGATVHAREDTYIFVYNVVIRRNRE